MEKLVVSLCLQVPILGVWDNPILHIPFSTAAPALAVSRDLFSQDQQRQHQQHLESRILSFDEF